MEKYINVTQEAGKQFYQEFVGKGPVVMLNLLKFKKIADYTDLDHLKPSAEISGKEAYKLYMKFTKPIIEKIGSRVLFYGAANKFLIGPTKEAWDTVLLVEHPSVEAFIAFAQNKEYLKTAGHRTAALEDARLLPITEKGDEKSS